MKHHRGKLQAEQGQVTILDRQQAGYEKRTTDSVMPNREEQNHLIFIKHFNYLFCFFAHVRNSSQIIAPNMDVDSVLFKLSSSIISIHLAHEYKAH